MYVWYQFSVVLYDVKVHAKTDILFLIVKMIPIFHDEVGIKQINR